MSLLSEGGLFVSDHDTEYFLYLTAWALYALIHSAAAGKTVKRLVRHHLRALAPYYRLAYNALAVVLLVPLGYLMMATPEFVLIEWSFPIRLVLILVQGGALVFAAVAAHHYDMAAFLGLHEEPSELCTSGILARVRHPFYTSLLIVLWCRDWTTVSLVTNVCATLYVRIGIALEERKLLVVFGDAYRAYRAAVPMVIPRIFRTGGSS